MTITSFPIDTVPPTANLIIYTPSGTVTATDVQGAIDQLAAGGTGSDPLLLIHGLDLETTQPVIGLNVDHTFCSGIKIGVFTSSTNLVPTFSNIECFSIDAQIYNGDYDFGFALQKTSFMANHIQMQGYAAAQRFCNVRDMHGYGMGDCFFNSDRMDYWGGPYSGDEGVGWWSASFLGQPQGTHAIQNVTSVTRTTFSTTLTQVVFGSQNVQTVTVASTAGANVGDWIVVNQQVDSGHNSIEAVKITAVGSGTISGVFRNDHANSETITPALVLGLTSLAFFGQQRVIVNMSGTSYSVGQIDGVSGFGLNNAGASWSNSMVGGNALNIGAIAVTKDDFTGAPFSVGSPMKSWYQIISVASPTFLNIHSTTVSGDPSYRGVGTLPSNYVIRPAARLLYLDNVGNTNAICETSTHTWTPGDTVESICCPYPDITGMDFRYAFYTGGCTARSLFSVSNVGARQFSYGALVQGSHDPLKTNNRDEWAYGVGMQINGSQVGIQLLDTMDVGINFNCSPVGIKRAIQWQNSGYITDNTFLGMDFAPGGGVPGIRFAFSGSGGTQLGIALSTVGGIIAGQPIAAFDVFLGNAADRGIRINSNGNTNNLIQLEQSTTVIGSVDTLANLSMKSIRGKAVTFSSLPGTPVEGMLVAVTDSTTAVWGAIITGSGANHVLAYYNGTNWTVAGK